MSKFILSGFGDEISPNMEEQIRVLKQNDIHCLEFRNMENKCIIDFSAKEIAQTHAMLEDNGIKVSALASPIGKIMITDDFPAHLDRFKKAIETAHLLGTKNIRMFSFYIPAGHAAGEFRTEVLSRWSQFIDAAKGSGLMLLHENERGIYGDNAERCLDILDSLSSPSVKAVFDPANFVQFGSAAYPDAFNLLKKHIAYIHIKDALYKDKSVVPAGEGDGRVEDVLRELIKDGYEGFLSIEPHLNNNEPGGGPKMFTKAADALKRILDRL